MAKISVILTVFNESLTLDDLLEALKAQTFQADEVVIVDGGSTDDTYSKLRTFSRAWPKLKVYQKTGNRSIGRNYAISHSTGSIIAITDAGCIPNPDWLKQIIKPFSNSHTQVVSGYYQGLATNIFQKCLIPYVLVMPDKANKIEFLPSSRSMALRRSIWNSSGGFDVKLSHNEDYAFAVHLKKIGINFTFAPQAVVNWLPRTDLKSASWMFMRFAIGDIQAGILRPKVKILAFRYLIFLYLLFITPLVLILIPPYLIWSILKNYRYVRDVRAIFWLPIIQLTADMSVLFGTVVGILARIST